MPKEFRLDPANPAHHKWLADIAITHFPFFAKQFLKIVDKDGNLVPFNLNRPQEKSQQIYQTHLANGGKPWRIYLKARQEGITTMTEGEIFGMTAFKTHQNSMVVAHTANAAQHILRIYNRYYDYFPEEFKYPRQRSNVRGIFFGSPDPRRNLNSQIRVDVAATGKGEGGVGRSETFQAFHGSEVAFWGDAEAVAGALMQTMSPKSMVVFESTANGVGGYFYDTWFSAVEGKSDFCPIFLAWTDMEEYCLYKDVVKEIDGEVVKVREEYTIEDLDKGESLSEDDLKEEQRMLDKGITPGQLMWRRWTIINKLKGSIDRFRQEYPENPEEAFLMSGRTVFKSVVLKKNINNLKNRDLDIKRGIFMPVFHGVVSPLTIRKPQFVEMVDGPVRIWEEPDPEWGGTHRYVIGADVSEGLPEGDESVAYCYDRVRDRFVAMIDTSTYLLGTEDFARQLALFGAYYSLAFMAPESNNHGQAVLALLRQLYPILHILRELKPAKIMRGMLQERLGWYTTKGTKPILVGRVKTWVDNEEGGMPDLNFWLQCLTFIQDDRGAYHAMNKGSPGGTGKLDDRVIAAGITLAVSDTRPLPQGGKLFKGLRAKDYHQKSEKTSDVEGEFDLVKGALHGWQ